MTIEQKFKVGDWIREKQDNTHIYLITETFMRNSQLWKEWSYDDFILWEPKAGEWCWFRSESMPEYIQVLAQFKELRNDNNLGKYTVMFNTETVEEGVISIHYNKCEPFIGTLPSFIKDKE